MKPTFFKTQADWRAWLQKHHLSKDELLVGYYKKDSGRPSMTWPESVDEALCHGWIDGIRRSIDEHSYSIRFTPRRPTSIWSARNVGRIAELEKLGLMMEAGRAAFALLNGDKTRIYSFERKDKAVLPPEMLAAIKRNPKAWKYFEAAPPGYRHTLAHWVTQAKKAETRQKRLQAVIDASAKGERVAPLKRPEKKSK